MAFQDICGKYWEGAEVDHINTIKSDNRASNLRWVDRRGNMSNPITRAKQIEANKERMHKCRQYDLNHNFIREWNSQNEAAKTLEISQGGINSCCRGKSHSSGGFIWESLE